MKKPVKDETDTFDITYYKTGDCETGNLKFNYLTLIFTFTDDKYPSIILDLYLRKNGSYLAEWKNVIENKCDANQNCSLKTNIKERTVGSWRQISKEQFIIRNIGYGTIDFYGKTITFLPSFELSREHLNAARTEAKMTVSDTTLSGIGKEQFCRDQRNH